MTREERGRHVAVLRYILRENFWAFCNYMDPAFFNDSRPHLKIVALELQGVTDGKTNKLMISLPPRGGKSYTVSMWCAWMIGRGVDDPLTSIMRNSYGQNLAEKFSYDIRAIVQSDKYLNVFPEVVLVKNHGRIEDWAVEGSLQSSYFCSGVGGAITGKGCRTAAILDDPIKNLEDAMSETILEKTWLWYLSTHRSRLETGCPEIHIATRWSRRDPIGLLLDSPEAEDYRKIVIPALTTDDKTFCEAVKTTEEYLALKDITDPFIWEAEFMQNPIEAMGLLYPDNELHKFSMAELRKDQIASVVGFTDTADEGTDYLASLTGAVVGDRIFITDVIFTQDPIEVTEPLVAQQIIDTGQSLHVVESNAGGKSFARNIKKTIAYKSKCHVSWKTTTTNKETRILMMSGQIKKAVWFRNDYKRGSDYDKFMRQLTSYVKMGKNKHDDAPDALTGLGEMVLSPRIRVLGGTQ